MNKSKAILVLAGAISFALSGQIMANDLPPGTPTDDDGNRYNRDRQYASEVSVSEAYLDMMQNKAEILDVRTRREYAAGHPERAYNVPYPRIDTGYNQNAADFYWAVYDLVKGNTDAPLYTLCRTGSRSIDAANILADPENEAEDPRRVAVLGAVPFSNVRNIWEGFVGQNLYAFIGGEPDPSIPLDLNNDGVINSDLPDVYAHTTDANPDKDGWRNFKQLAWSTKIRKPLAYLQDKWQYDCWQTDDGCPPPSSSED